MTQTRVLGAGLVVLGAILLYFGLNAASSPAGELREAFTGRYSNETIAYLVAGAVSAVVGLMFLLRR
ncbi:MAG: DUF3185 family protein [Chromatiales bacterium]|jgi:hypothetical protein